MRVTIAIFFVTLLMAACSDDGNGGNSGALDGGGDSGNDAQSRLDSGSDSDSTQACTTPSGTTVSPGETACVRHCVMSCGPNGFEETDEACGEGHSDVKIDHANFGWQTQTTTGEPAVSGNVEVGNYGEARTDNLNCELELFDENGESMGTREIMVFGDELHPSRGSNFGFSWPGQDADADPEAQVTCTADNEPCTLIDEDNQVRERVRSF